MRYLGEDGVAAFTAINYILFIATTVFLGISDGIIPIISYNFGAGRLDRIEKVLRLAGRVNFMIGITLFAILFFFGQQITSFFFKGGEALDALAIANYGITIYCFTFLMSGLNILASSYFTAIGNAKLSVVISMLRSLVFVTFGIIVYPSLFGIQSIWYNVPVAELCTLFISFMLVRRELLKEAVLKINQHNLLNFLFDILPYLGQILFHLLGILILDDFLQDMQFLLYPLDLARGTGVEKDLGQ